MIRTTNNIVRTLLSQASLPTTFWVEALHTTVYLLNIRPTSVPTYLSPTHILYNKIPSYALLITFGCLCYLNVTTAAPKKLSPQSTPCIILGHPGDHSSYLCLSTSTNKVITSCHVIFDESIFMYSIFSLRSLVK